MKAKFACSSLSLMVCTFLLGLLSFALVGCMNNGAYQHTTVVRASVGEFDINALGATPLMHVKDGTLTVTITTQISLGNATVK